MKEDPAGAIRLLSKFAGENLTRTLSRIETDVRGLTADQALGFLKAAGAERDVLAAAGEMKRLACQIDVTIHALGILLCLPHVLEPGERVEYVSLGAGNTGRQFDLETDRRIAEFKFINWRGGSESIRQNSIFKDFFMLADSNSTKRKILYLLGTAHALKFLHGGRSIKSVLSRGDKVQVLFFERFGDRYRKVKGYFHDHHHAVSIVDVTPWLGELAVAVRSPALMVAPEADQL
ncbi:hypothetical protein NKJ06_15220 [Mesorhizobium sp. M0293]|uniref:hypothetical protein n=1 Tax=Mesorhizobium sp. M0293 TaxID=2956930 RepID=UPI003335C2FF